MESYSIEMARKGVSKKVEDLTPAEWQSACRTLKIGCVVSREDIAKLQVVIEFKRANPGKRWTELVPGSLSETRKLKKEATAAKRALPPVRDGKILGRELVSYFLVEYGVSPTEIYLRKIYPKFESNSYMCPGRAIATYRDLRDIESARSVKPGLKADSIAPPGYFWGKNLDKAIALCGSKTNVNAIRGRLLGEGVAVRKYQLISLDILRRVLAVDAEIVPRVTFAKWEGLASTKQVRKVVYQVLAQHGDGLSQDVWKSSCITALGIRGESMAIPKELTFDQAKDIVLQIERRLRNKKL